MLAKRIKYLTLQIDEFLTAYLYRQGAKTQSNGKDE